MNTDVQIIINPSQENGSKIQETSEEVASSATVTNGKSNAKSPSKNLRRKRSRSTTPQKKKDKKSDDSQPENNGPKAENENNSQEKKQIPETVTDKAATEDTEIKKAEKSLKPLRKSSRRAAAQEAAAAIPEVVVNNIDVEVEIVINDTTPHAEPEVAEMSPLVLPIDEPDPELQFEENSDDESNRAESRCKTRRSQTRNLPTPKTPKSITDSESSELNSLAPTPTPETLNDTHDDSLNNAAAAAAAEEEEDNSSSMKVEIGSDTTRLNYTEHDDSYLNYSRSRTFTETIRGLSARRSIRPLNDSYRNLRVSSANNKFDLNTVDGLVGVKRKRSVTPETRKKFKSETSSSFMNYLSSPISNFKNKFISDEKCCSSPQLTGYKDNTNDIHSTEIIVADEDVEKKNWCVLM